MNAAWTRVTPEVKNRMRDQGYLWIPKGRFQGGEMNGKPMRGKPGSDGFFRKAHDKTNREWADFARGLDPFVRMELVRGTGAIRIADMGKNPEAILGSGLRPPADFNWDSGQVLLSGGIVCFRLLEEPSKQYDEGERIFSGWNQSVVGVSWVHAVLHNLLSEVPGGLKGWRLALPMDVQEYYVASFKGTREYPTSTGALYNNEGQKLMHIDENRDRRGTTAAVDDERYPAGPFGVRFGSVWRWMGFNPEFIKRGGDLLWGPYGLRGGSFGSVGDGGRAVIRRNLRPGGHYRVVGFAPVVVRQDS